MQGIDAEDGRVGRGNERAQVSRGPRELAVRAFFLPARALKICRRSVPSEPCCVLYCHRVVQCMRTHMVRVLTWPPTLSLSVAAAISFCDVRGHQSLVIETIKDMADERKCYRLINGVLVQHSVKDVKPVLSATVANILEQQKKFAERFTFCNKRVSELQSKYNIREASPEDLQKQQQQQAQLQDGAAPSVSQ